MEPLRWPDVLGLALTVAGTACLFAAALFFDLDSTGARRLMAASAACYVPGAYLLLRLVRERYGRGP